MELLVGGAVFACGLLAGWGLTRSKAIRDGDDREVLVGLLRDAHDRLMSRSFADYQCGHAETTPAVTVMTDEREAMIEDRRHNGQ